MSELDKVLFCTESVVGNYWTENAIQQGSQYFHTNPKKLTRNVFDELVKTIDSTIFYTNNSDLLDVEEAKKIESDYIKKDLSNVEELLNIAQEYKEIFQQKYDVLSKSDFVSLTSDYKKAPIPKIEKTKIPSYEITFPIQGTIRKNRTSSETITTQNLLADYELISDTVYTIRINEEFSYFYFCLMLRAKTQQEAVCVLQENSSYSSQLRVHAKLSIEKVQQVFGEIVFPRGGLCVSRYSTESKIEETQIELQSSYIPFNKVENHRHSNTTVTIPQMIYTHKIERVNANVSSTNMDRNIQRCYIHLGNVSMFGKGIVRNG